VQAQRQYVVELRIAMSWQPICCGRYRAADTPGDRCDVRRGVCPGYFTEDVTARYIARTRQKVDEGLKLR